MSSYRDALKRWNEHLFGRSVFAFPRKGYVPYNQVQQIRAGKAVPKSTTVAELTKAEEAKPYAKPAGKEQAKKLAGSKNPWIAFLASHTKRDNETYKDFVKRMAVLYNSMDGKAKNEIIEIPKPEFDKEHKELIKVLATGTDKEQKAEAEKQEKEVDKQKWLEHYRNMSIRELDKIDNSAARTKMTAIEGQAFFEVHEEKRKERDVTSKAEEEEQKKGASAKMAARLSDIVTFYNTLTEKSSESELDDLENRIQKLLQDNGDMVDDVQPMVKWILKSRGLVKAKKYPIRNGVNYYCHYCAQKSRFDNLMLDYIQELECDTCEFSDEIKNWYRKPPASKKT